MESVQSSLQYSMYRNRIDCLRTTGTVGGALKEVKQSDHQISTSRARNLVVRLRGSDHRMDVFGALYSKITLSPVDVTQFDTGLARHGRDGSITARRTTTQPGLQAM
jgi:hypothetical protein